MLDASANLKSSDSESGSAGIVFKLSRKESERCFKLTYWVLQDAHLHWVLAVEGSQHQNEVYY